MNSWAQRIACLLFALNVAAVCHSGWASTPPIERQTSKPAVFNPYRRPITIWIPPYAVESSKEQLMASYGGSGVDDAITHLALQFWTPTRSGRVERTGNRGVTDRAIIELRDWAHARRIRVMLCVYNGEKWNWSVARSAFAEHQKKFVKNLVAEMERWKLDGIDIDLEGAGAFEADKKPFVLFMKALSKELRAQGRHLTVDTYAYIWNVPNQTWWPELLPLVDALTAMGYEDTGAYASEWRSYAELKKAAGTQACKLQIGVPSSREQWKGNTVSAHLDWIRKDGNMGVAIWDAQLKSPAWRTPGVWRTLEAIRQAPTRKKRLASVPPKATAFYCHDSASWPPSLSLP